MRSGKYYQAIKQNGKKRDLHRAIMEQTLGRKLLQDEVVHHIDGNINNNEPDNLCVMTREEHGRIHGIGRHMPEECRRKIAEIRTGSSNLPCRSLTYKNVSEILRLLDNGLSTRKIADKLHIGRSTILGISLGRTYKDWVSQIRGA